MIRQNLCIFICFISGKTSEFELNPEIQVKWLPSKLRISIGENGRLSVLDLDINPLENEQETENNPLVSDYELTAVVVYVKDETEDKHNLVSLIKVGSFYLERAGMECEGSESWFLFNDFW